MNISKRTMVFGLLVSVSSYPALAQFGGLGSMLGGGGGGDKPNAADPKQLEVDLKAIIESTSVALSSLADAMGLKETAAKVQKNAQDIKSGAVGLSDSASTVSEVCSSVVAEITKNQQQGRKLDAASSKLALQAIEPGIMAFPQWKSVVDGVKSLDSTALLGAASLAQAVPKIPTAAKNTFDMYRAGISYLTFSGADTSSVQKAAEQTLKF